MIRVVLFIQFLLYGFSESQSFLEELRYLEVLPANIDMANIVRSNNGGCSLKANQLFCIVPDTATLEKVKSDFQGKGAKFTDTTTWDKTIVGHDGSFGIGAKSIRVSIQVCFTQVFEYYMKKIEKKLSQLTEDICRDSPDDCDIKVTEPCDKGGDCIAAAKTQLKNKSLITDATYQLLNRSKDLLLNDSNKKDKALADAFTQLKTKLQLDTLKNPCGITPAKCMENSLSRSANIQAFDTINSFTKAMVEKIVSECK